MREKTIQNQDISLARKTLLETKCSVVVIKKGNVLTKKHGQGIKPLLETIEELGKKMEGTTVGDRILGKASAMLCIYSKVASVYSTMATKKAIAALIQAKIPGQTDKIIPYIKNKNGKDICPFEKMLQDIHSPEEAYKILKKHFVSKRT